MSFSYIKIWITFPEANYGTLFMVAVIMLKVSIVRNRKKEKLWEGGVLNVFTERSCLFDLMVGSKDRDDPIWDG